MADVLKIISIFSFVAVLDWSFSSSLSDIRMTHFFFFAFLAAFSVKRGFVAALPVCLSFILLFDGIFSGGIGFLSFFTLFLLYGTSFLIRRFNFERFGGRFFLSICIGVGMSLFPIGTFLLDPSFSFQGFFSDFSVFLFLAVIIFGAVLFFLFLTLLARMEKIPNVLGSKISL